MLQEGIYLQSGLLRSEPFPWIALFFEEFLAMITIKVVGLPFVSLAEISAVRVGYQLRCSFLCPTRERTLDITARPILM